MVDRRPVPAGPGLKWAGSSGRPRERERQEEGERKH